MNTCRLCFVCSTLVCIHFEKMYLVLEPKSAAQLNIEDGSGSSTTTVCWAPRPPRPVVFIMSLSSENFRERSQKNE